MNQKTGGHHAQRLHGECCGIGFHPLHSYPAIALYAAALAVKPLRLVAAGLLIHMLVDGSDCIRMSLGL